jgi:hypothetical protein
MLRVVFHSVRYTSEYIRSICRVWKQTHTQKITSVFSLFLNGRAYRNNTHTHTHTQSEGARFFGTNAEGWERVMCRRAENVCTGGIVEREKEKRTGLLLARTGVELVRRGGGNQRSQERRRRVPTKTGGYRSCSAGVLHDSTVGSQVVC